MSIEATATALVQDEVSAPVEITPEAAPTGESDLQSELDAIWDRSQAKEEEDETPEGAETPTPEPEKAPAEAETTEPEAEVADEAEDAAEAPQTEAPSELPLAIKKNWAAIPQEAQDAFLETQREANRKLGEQGRMMQGIAPIRDVLAEAVKDLPSLANMRPQQVAQEVMQLAKISNDFNTKPVETIMGLVKQHGLEQALSQHFSGQSVTDGAQQNAALQQEVTALKRKISQISDPEFMSSQFDAFSTQQQASATVNEFAASKADWSDVEPHLSAAIQFVQASSATPLSHKDTLERAYNLALSQIKPDAIKAEPEKAAPKAAAPIDPERSRKAQKAKSVNVPDRGATSEKPLTERQLMERIWAKNQS